MCFVEFSLNLILGLERVNGTVVTFRFFYVSTSECTQTSPYNTQPLAEEEVWERIIVHTVAATFR